MEICLSIILDDEPAVLHRMPYDPDTTTFEDLKYFLSMKYNDKVFRIHLPDIGTVSFPRDATTKLLSSTVWPSWTIPITVRPQGDKLVVVVVREDEDTETLEVRSSDTVSELRNLIQRATNIPVSDQVLSLDLSEDDNEDHVTMADLGLVDFARIHLTQAVQGGAPSSSGGGGVLNMIDIFNQHARQEYKFNFSSVARLYQAIGYGLVLEGVCMSRRCEAFGRRVFNTKRFGVFDMRNPKIAECPACRAVFSKDIRSIGFNNCFYSIRGIESGSRKEQVVRWTRVGDVERFWDRSYAGVKGWLFLQIVTAPLVRGMQVPGSAGRMAPVARECLICGKAIGQKNGLGTYNRNDVVMRPCEHSFHANCWNNWSIKMPNSSGGSVQRQCPVCVKN